MFIKFKKSVSNNVSVRAVQVQYALLWPSHFRYISIFNPARNNHMLKQVGFLLYPFCNYNKIRILWNQ